MEDYLYWIWLTEMKAFSKQQKEQWLKEYGHPRDIFSQSKTIGINEDLSAAIKIANDNIKYNIKTITPDDKRHKIGMPLIIYYQGSPFEGKQAAVIGTRDCSLHGKYYTQVVCENLLRDNICVNSGLAKGVDIAAHRKTLKEARITQAFLAHGLDQCYPKEHKLVKDQIVESGAVYSIFPVGVPPLRHHFLQRNHLMASFSDQVIVVEAPVKSGSLTTAEYARSLNKPIFTIKGTDSPRCAGNRELLKNGATEIEVPLYQWNKKEDKYINAIRRTPMSLRILKTRFIENIDDIERILLDLESHGWISYKTDGKWHYNGW